MTPSRRRLMLPALLAAVVPASHALSGIIVPAMSSRPGAAYTVYLDFGGFAYTGTWSGGTPGTTPAYDSDGNAGSFSTSELAAMREIWARVSEKYVALNVNVTTVDPAAIAGQTGTDLLRQTYYDATPRVQHTVIGGNGSWTGGGGVSFVGVISGSYPGTGYHTNWVFAGEAPTFTQFVAEASAHENGHAFGLSHQSDFGDNGTVNGTGSTLINEYSGNSQGSGNGSWAPIMGVSYYNQRGLWRLGNADSGGRTTQNDYTVFGGNPAMTLVDDGVSHQMSPAAGELPVGAGHAVLPSSARGFITPTTLSDPNPIGAGNYTRDDFRFFSVGASITLACVDGSQNVTPGSADPGATLDSTLKIYSASGILVATATRASDTLSESVTVTLPAGNYYAEIASAGGYVGIADPSAKYFTAGSYLLTGANAYVRSNLTGVNLAGASLISQDLSSAGLASATLTTATLALANLAGANLTSANLAGANLSVALLTSANMTGSTVTSATLRSADLTGANLASANLSFSDLRGASGYAPTASTAVRGVIQPSGQIAGFSFQSPVETLNIASSSIAAQTAGSVTGTGAIAMGAGARLNLAPPASTSVNVRLVAGITVAFHGVAGNIPTVTSSILTATTSGRTALPELSYLGGISMANDGGALGARSYYGLLNLGTNDALVRGGSLPDLADMARAFNLSGKTAGIGTLSAIPNTAIAVISNLSGVNGVQLFTTFDGLFAQTSDVLLKFTYLGDTDLNGRVDASDLSTFLAGRAGHLTGWQNGDFNYDGSINSADLGLLMTSLSAGGASLGDEGFGGGSVPEPSLVLLPAALGLVLARRRRI